MMPMPDFAKMNIALTLMIVMALAGLAFMAFAGWRMDRGSGRASFRQGDSRVVDAALSVLNERYARGEIDRREYEERRRLIEGGRQPTIVEACRTPQWAQSRAVLKKTVIGAISGKRAASS